MSVSILSADNWKLTAFASFVLVVLFYGHIDFDGLFLVSGRLTVVCIFEALFFESFSWQH